MELDQLNSTPGLGNQPELSVVIPVYNESAAIIDLVHEVNKALAGRLKFEIIVVDDGSEDDTVNRLHKLIDDHALPLRLIKHKYNCGQSTSIMSGIQAARSGWIATLDGDGQNNPADIINLLESRDRLNDPKLRLVCGYRKKRNDNFIKRISSRIANYVRSRILGDQTPDTGCGLKLIHRNTFLTLPFFDHMHRFLPALVRRAGGEIISVEVSHRPRTTGKSKYTLNNRLWVGIVDLVGMMWLIRRGKVANKEEVTRHDN